MKIRQRAFAITFAALLVPSFAFAGYFGGTNPSGPIHVNQTVTLYFTGNQYDNGQVYYLDIYANGSYLCTTVQNTTPIWTCTLKFSTAGTYNFTGTSHSLGGGTDTHYITGGSLTIVP